MVSLRFAAALAAVGLFASGMVFAEGAKPNDAQIAHICLHGRPARHCRCRTGQAEKQE